jgi:phytoene dehydrogenase-like protein
VPTLPALWQTVGDLLRAEGIDGHLPHRRFIDNQLLISMQCLADESVALSGALALEVYRYGAFRLPAGTATIAQDLLTALEARGGRCFYHSWVRMLARHGDCWLATTADGAEYAARTVIANLSPADLAGLLGGAAPTSLVQAARRRRQPWGAVVLFAALDAANLPGPLPRYHQIIDRYDGPVEDGGSCFVSIFEPDPHDRSARARLTVSTHTRVEGWWGLRDRSAYLEQKHAVEARLLRAAERAVPDLQQRLIFSEVATPRSYARWTGRHDGRVGGVPQTRTQANLLAQSHRTGLPGLFLCGDSVFPGQGTIGVTLSGINAARSAIRAAGRGASRRQAVVGSASRSEPGGYTADPRA